MGGGSGAADAVFVCASRRPQCAGDANCRLATPTAGGAIQSQLHGAACSDAPSKPILAATPARSISLPRPAIANGAPLSETKVKADLASRLSVRSARHSSPSSHLSRSAANSDIPIKQLSPNTVGQIDGVYSRDAPSFSKIYREERGVSLSRLIATEDRCTGDDVEASRPDDENSLGSRPRFEETTIQRWCCHLPWAHNHKSASKTYFHRYPPAFAGSRARMTPLPCLHSLKINVKIEHL